MPISSILQMMLTSSSKTWTQIQKVRLGTPSSGERFGHAVDLFNCTADGNDYLLVGAPVYNSSEGRAALFQRSGDVFSEHKVISNPSASSDDNYGRSVAGDGSFFIIGSPTADFWPGSNIGGEVNIYSIDSNGNTAIEITLTGPETTAGMGTAVSMTGNYVFIGCAGDNQTSDSYVTIYEYDGTWDSQNLISTDLPGYANVGDVEELGRSIDSYGDRVVIGAPTSDSSSGGTNDWGIAYVYRRDGALTWTLEQRLQDTSSSTDDCFGGSVAISNTHIAIGIRNGDNPLAIDYGEVRIFTRSGTSWSLTDSLTDSDFNGGIIATISDFGSSFFSFGQAVAFSDNGKYLAIGGSKLRYNGANVDEGAVLLYQLEGSTFNLKQVLVADDADTGDNFGSSVDFLGDYLAIGAPGETGDDGSVYIFKLQ